MASLSITPMQQFLDDNGVPYAGGKLYTFEAGSSSFKASYTDYDSEIEAANPIILDSGGKTEVWLGSGLYKMVLTDSDDNLVWTIDNVGTGSGGATAAYVVQTVIGSSNALKALAAGIAGEVICLGYRTVGDEGGGLYYWSSTATGGDDGITVNGNTAYGATGRWVRHYTGDVNPRWYGAYGTGTDNDTSYFAAALTYCAANSKALHLTNGTYLLSSTITPGSVVFKFDANAKLSFSSFAPDMAVEITDRNQHFINADADYVPHFPAGTESRPEWFGWAQSNTDNYLYVNEAINSLASGGSVVIPDGTSQISDRINLTSSVYLKGDASSMLVVKSGFAGSTYVVGGQGISNSTVDKIIVQSRSDTTVAGIYIDGTNCTIKNNRVSDCLATGVAAVSNVQVENNTVSACAITGTSTAGNGLIIRDNEVRSPSGIGIYVEDRSTDDPDSVFHGPVVVTGNRISDVDTTGIAQYNFGQIGKTYSIANNIIQSDGTVVGIQATGMVHGTITGNVIYASTDSTAVKTASCTDTSVANNIVHGAVFSLENNNWETVADSLHVQYGGDSTVTNNLIVGNDVRIGNDATITNNVSVGGSIYANNIDYTTASGTFDATFQYDGISIPFSYVVFGGNRVTITWPTGADMTGGATIHNSVGTPVPAEIRPDGTNVYQYCPGFAWDYDTNTTGPCYVRIVSNGQLSIGQSPSLTSNTIRLERGGAVYSI